jgi:NAD(P)-dependent dehydrogenase (short-subunit alcohol dehydrogenase family)
MDIFELKGKTAVVTGGARGIGAATVKLFREAGVRVEVLDIENGCDVTDEQAVKRAFASIGEIDFLVNNAGRAVRKPAVELAREEWDGVIGLNLTATFLCSRLAHPYLKKRGGGLTVVVRVRGERTAAAFAAWQLRTGETLRSGYLAQRSAYDNDQARRQARAAYTSNQPAAMNRAVEMLELKRACQTVPVK